MINRHIIAVRAHKIAQQQKVCQGERRVVVIVIAHIIRITLYVQIRIIVACRVNLYARYRYRFRIAYIINYLQLVIVAFFNFQVVNVSVLVQVKVVDLVSRIVDGLFKSLRIGTVFNKLCQFIHVEPCRGIVLNSHIVLLRMILIARENKQY